ncbi:hypothetical protein [Herbaspirillum aquaticum]|uniref:hypothetical protein n=1 Tax=Herbaspirillum aquaticum TaxID=568783 RepID=UPI0024DE5B83|nr:hypothetical protein [Herbaspirillum aquaticum]
MKAIFAAALLCCFFVSSFTAPIEQEKNEQAQAKAEAKLKARLFTKFPDPAIAAMLPPAQNKD